MALFELKFKIGFFPLSSSFIILVPETSSRNKKPVQRGVGRQFPDPV